MPGLVGCRATSYMFNGDFIWIQHIGFWWSWGQACRWFCLLSSAAVHFWGCRLYKWNGKGNQFSIFANRQCLCWCMHTGLRARLWYNCIDSFCCWQVGLFINLFLLIKHIFFQHIFSFPAPWSPSHWLGILCFRPLFRLFFVVIGWFDFGFEKVDVDSATADQIVRFVQGLHLSFDTGDLVSKLCFL